MSFDIVTVGSSGGPVDRHTSAYLIRTTSVDAASSNSHIAIDAGTLVSGLADILNNRQHCAFFAPEFHNQKGPWAIVNDLIASVYLTHSHLDHIGGLVINSAGLCNRNPKRVCALGWVIDVLKRHVFNGPIWPNMTTEGPNAAGCLVLERLVAKECVPTGATNLSITPYPITHGSSESTAYILRDSSTERLLLVWGDVEPTSVSKNPKNREVWEAVATNYSQLAGVLIECSYPDAYLGDDLYGHLTPTYLVAELETLAKLSGTRLEGLTIIVTHVKDYPYSLDLQGLSRSVHAQVLHDLQHNAGRANLKCVFTIATQGKSFTV